MAPEITIRTFRRADRSQVVELWRSCDLLRPWNDPHADIERKLTQQPDLFLVAELDADVVGTVMAGYEGHRGWLNYLAVAPDRRRLSLGRRLVAAAEALLAERGCPKVNLQIRSSNAGVVEFYERLGYRVDEVISMGKRL